ncbi:uncharacterized protein LOC121874622 [Homarus americanus]|uniref:uncharacterized protein LOC121874622 n=1 Tax=Homarus americanus TaxID=6706 RepID=UPI001C439EE0|nr:uncharacterized protein LOC121874622 [Homarus americanus]
MCAALAMEKRAIQYTFTTFGLNSDLAVDGDDISASLNFYHSAYRLVYPWWAVDLSYTRTIYRVRITMRQDSCCLLRSHDIEVRVGDVREESGNLSSYTLFSTYKGPYDISQGHIACDRKDGVSGRYISIQRVTPEDHMLQLVEEEEDIFCISLSLH